MMDIPRDRSELQRLRAEKWLLGFTVTFSLSIVLYSGLAGANRTNSLPADTAVEYTVPALPDNVWMDRIYEWAENAAPLNSLIVSYKDFIITEHYFRGMSPHNQVNVKSVSKSILSALIGIALQRGLILSLDQKLADLLPSYFDENTDPRKKEITLRHLITMSAGLEGTSFDNYDPWIASSNWIRHAINQPLVSAPGSRYVYSTGNTHLLSVVLTQATGMSTLDFGRRYLFEPLGIAMRAWDRDPQGYYLGGNNMHFTPREMLALGQLYLHRGRVGERQIVSSGWIEESFTPYNRSSYSRGGYGYCWRYRRMAGEDVYYAVGYGGQYIYIVPALDLTLVATSSLVNRPPGRRRPSVSRLLNSMVIPAIRDRIRNRSEETGLPVERIER